MDLTLSHTGDYVVRAAIALADAPRGRYRTISEIAEEMELPRSFAPQVLGTLAKAGVAESRAGRGGGYRLARPASGISMLEVVEAAEGPLASVRCPIRGGPCRWDEACAVHPTWTRAAEAMRKSLAATTLAQVARADRRLAEGGKVTPMPPTQHRTVSRRS